MSPILCNPCAGFLQQAMIPDPTGIYSHTMSQRWRLRSNTGHLLSEDCELCALIRAALNGGENRDLSPLEAMRQNERWKSRVLDHGKNGKPYPQLTVRFLEGCNLVGNRKERFRRAGIAGLHVEIAKVGESRTGYHRGHLNFYASAGSPAAKSGRIVGQPPLPTGDSAEALARLRAQFEQCLASHAECRGGRPAEDLPMLPTRVIDLGQPGISDTPRLLETLGLRAHYTALSHCWGSTENRPLVTTKQKLSKHCLRIDDVPKTFEDAFLVTRALGLRYIWIDSLCIVQDDDEDWTRESQVMGKIYERAQVTIAASDAWDSTRGLFVTCPSLPPPLEIPFIDPTSRERQGSYFISLPASFGNIDPEESVLNSRAWATQEWMLSHRMGHFLAGGTVWRCKSLHHTRFELHTPVKDADFGVHESGLICYLSKQNPKWEDLVEQFTKRNLTKPKDRLYALQGLADMIGQGREDDYYFGSWSADIVSQLLWICTDEVRSTKAVLPKVPSWSWMSTQGPVRFWRKDILKIAGSNICQDVEITSDASIRMTCRFNKIGELWPYMLEKWDANDNYDSSPRYSFPTSIKRMHLELLPIRPLHYFLETNISSLLAFFDTGLAPDEPVYCACLFSEGGDQDDQSPIINLLLLREGEDGAFYRIGVGIALLFEKGFGTGSSGFGETFRRIEIR
ncbi:hypothetical protein GLAREA_03171 [Glarea lozoyensis ATCC 20868]|uniref:Heterokaryon incompatibility domain-containing protein n=1 Tax=Glarea lozoyensis (strain ATCC 20868 / MF5171) TaxID=1116229 RepID=S3D5B2_GLAL2|nr:uncharacterized protein GLAREA_03171 [Glarea lozoyensis ATCC 20868]EPE27256.1 hypothetical protein GLAREA_03171 [Glarea lozoyensis ATCC 20868]